MEKKAEGRQGVEKVAVQKVKAILREDIVKGMMILVLML